MPNHVFPCFYHFQSRLSHLLFTSLTCKSPSRLLVLIGHNALLTSMRYLFKLVTLTLLLFDSASFLTDCISIGLFRTLACFEETQNKLVLYDVSRELPRVFAFLYCFRRIFSNVWPCVCLDDGRDLKAKCTEHIVFLSFYVDGLWSRLFIILSLTVICRKRQYASIPRKFLCST
uniref:Uncharacterized protein n=1 Tax=Schistocephalus solidus TaxID=70667 RepID=A0A0X3P310_SCHSO